MKHGYGYGYGCKYEYEYWYWYDMGPRLLAIALNLFVVEEGRNDNYPSVVTIKFGIYQPVAESMAKHHPDLIMCRKQPGIAIGRLCEKCDGKCVICDSYVRPCTLVRVCDECNYGSFQGRCVICGGVGISDAYYCKECTQQEKDRDGCPKIVNLGSAKTDLFYERKKYGFKKR
ncbi:hypothetical protein TEA_015305 [Camellia sinensis var. sinensis]|uniref:PHD finger-like domain-containing protein 5A n=1 Tax=Camellia sinensis var. sinensis TaxID=542762 RepID=A0A4S4DZR4_CAMSN|nr:hypothetical protein TEA_015305 [Camellia sinensis var. sinensis]